jgi:hypothetical protein
VNDLRGQVEIECWDANNLIKTEMLGRVALNIEDVIGPRSDGGAFVVFAGRVVFCIALQR